MQTNVIQLNSRRRINRRGTTTSLFSRVAVVCAFVVVSLAAMAETPSDTAPPKAPGAAESAGASESVRVQPRANGFAPNSAEEAAVQENLTIFNSRQDVLDAEFDRKLRICRGC
jgi:hypothetical protein